MRFRAKELGLVLVGSLFSGAAHAVPWPIGVSTSVPSIEATFGQYRKILIGDCPGGVACSHFQRGLSLDPTPTGAGTTVKAILAGTVRQINTGVPFISVTGTNGRIITYRYVTAAGGLNPGDSVTLLQTLGTISGSAVDIEAALDGATWGNPLYSLGSVFTNYYPVPPSVHPAISEPSFIDANTFAPIDSSKPIGNRQFHIIANILGAANSPSSPSVGVDQVGFYIEPVSIDTETFVSGLSYKFGPYLKQTYNQLRFTSLLTPGTAYYLADSVEGGPFYYIATNGVETPSLESNIFHDGEWQACVIAKGALESGFTTGQPCASVTFDRTAPSGPTYESGGASFTFATSTPVVTVSGYDKHGLYTINLTGPGGFNQTSTNPGVTASYSDTFPIGGGTLADGQYTAKITDLAGNVNSNTFAIKTTGASTDNKDAAGETLANVFSSTYCPSGHAVDSTGVAALTLSSSGFSDTTPFDCTPAKISTDAVGHGLCGLPSGSYTTTSVNCAGVTSSTTSTITSGTNLGYVCLGGTCAGFAPTAGSSVTIVVNTAGACGGCSLDFFCKSVALSPLTSCHTSGGGLPFVAEYTGSCQKGLGFSISNSTNTRWTTALQITAGAGNTGFLNDVGAPLVSETLNGTVTMPEVNTLCPGSNAANTATIRASYWDLLPTQVEMLGTLLSAIIRQVLAYVPGTLNAAFGSNVVLTSSGTLTISIPNPSSILVSTQTLAIYRFDGVDWSSAAVTDQTVSKDTTTSVISATGSIITSGYYALLFQANDSSAPITTFAIQGSTFNFDGALFVSTDAFVVLTATDPIVNGYASTVASITYRIDPSSGSPFYIYSSSIPLPLGTHVFEYRSLDYAGNTEAVKTATFTVTAGTAFRTPSSAQVPGVLLNGFLGSGAKLEIESQAQNSLTLLISSVNRQGMVAVDNIGEVGIGVTPQANLNIGAGAVALQLRSGNSTSSVTSNQIAFGYNGDYSMRHLLRTEHSTSTDGNKMDFLVWNTGAASTTTLASLNVLSLQGISTAHGASFHVQPVGEPDAEVEVSNGLSTGGGTMQRLQVVAPSSRRFKTDIKDLSEKDEDRALSDVVGLKHANFRYKTRRKDGRLIEDTAQPLRTGLIYEEAPESIRDGAEALSTTERLVNVEMALKAAMRRLEELQARHDKLKARRKP